MTGRSSPRLNELDVALERREEKRERKEREEGEGG